MCLFIFQFELRFFPSLSLFWLTIWSSSPFAIFADCNDSGQSQAASTTQPPPGCGSAWVGGVGIRGTGAGEMRLRLCFVFVRCLFIYLTWLLFFLFQINDFLLSTLCGLLVSHVNNLTENLTNLDDKDQVDVC